MIKQEISKLRKKITALEAEETILSVKTRESNKEESLFKKALDSNKLDRLRKEIEEQKVRLKYLENR